MKKALLGICLAGAALTLPAEVRLKGRLGELLDAMIERQVSAADVDYLTGPFVSRFEREGGWQTEFWGKWMLSAVPYGNYSASSRLTGKIERGLDRILGSQEPGGYVGGYPEGLRLGDGWDVWGVKYTMLGLLQYVEEGRDAARRKACQEACRRLCDYVAASIGPNGRLGREAWQTGFWSGYASSSILEAVMRLHTVANDRRDLDFAAFLVKGMTEPASGPRLVDLALKGVPVADRNGYGNAPDLSGAYACRQNRWKAYEMMSCYLGLIEYAQVSGRHELFEAALASARDIAAEEVTLAGGCSCSEAWFHGARKQHRPHERLQETCVTITWMRLCAKLLEKTGDAFWADQLERTFYNAYLGALSRSCAEFEAYTPLSGSRFRGMNHCHMHMDCCTANGPRGFLSWLDAFCRSSDARLTINFYASAQSKEFDMYSLYPRSDFARIVTRFEGKRVLRLRIPSWCADAVVRVNGKPQPRGRPGAYLSVDREWRKGDVVEVRLPMPVVAHRLDGFLAFTRGPVLLARDSRFADGDLMEPFRKGLKDGQRMAGFEPVRTPSDDFWMAFSAVLPIGAHHENPEGAYGRAVTFCDFSSAGNSWKRDDHYRTWFPEELGPTD